MLGFSSLPFYTFKWCISRQMGSFPHECEATELFTGSIQNPAFFDQPARNRARQGVVPDFLLQPPSGQQELVDVSRDGSSFCHVQCDKPKACAS